ncbi:hypothetical protein LNAOJCKE_2991 [Methylorubrum aminovorans]|uniref:P22 coat-protein 5 family protein n=1 Tax=Methylorubrum aminovorans TaxID=269069 RepID=A0ABQ4UFK3_9HYPH|nr:P22 phage major capsid protein family protein [Methylorubrum aminovorans]GJE65778.1 hypothetical protein LNAOJCKE_2991 [Methylorubrum aminovorans]GMA75865.1 head protein [Methylorubrum aminovorans]
MPNSIITPAIVAKEACVILDNALVMANQVHRAHEEDYEKKVNGYKPGATVSIRKPAQFKARRGAQAQTQDVKEGTTAITVDQQVGVDFNFTSSDLTLKIGELSERVIKPALVQIVNAIDTDLMSLYSSVYNWVGTPGNVINTFAKLGAGGQRMDEMAVPGDARSAVLSPADQWALLGTQTGLYMQDAAKDAYRMAKLGRIGDFETFKSQNVPTLTTGARGGAPVVNGNGQAVVYDGAVMNTYTQTLNINGASASVTGAYRAGDVFTIAGVFAVNPVTKKSLPYLQQFVVTADANTDGTGAATLTISPQIIVSGAFQTVSAAPATGAALSFMGVANMNYSQSLAFHKNAFALCMVPMEKPPGAVDVGSANYKGISVRVIPYYDGTNDVSNWRLDVLYGFKAIDPRLATRISG